MVGVTADLTDTLQRGRSRARGRQELGGKGGGGRPDMAQAGGPDGARAQDALDAVGAMIGGSAA